MSATDETPVLVDRVDSTAVITLHRPDRLNAWTQDLGTAYYDALDAAVADPGVRVIVVTGSGRGFCAGADMSTLQDLGDTGGAGVEERTERRQPHHATTLPKPVIAAVNGACAGLGLVLALSCDLRFAASGAKFTAAFSRRGLIAEYGSSWLLPNLVGTARAFDLLVSGRVVLAEEAERLGLVNEVVEADRLLDRTLAYAADLGAKVSPSSMATMKAQIYRHPRMPLQAAVDESVVLMRASLEGEDFVEGVDSFVEKRDPAFAAYGSGTVMPSISELEV